MLTRQMVLVVGNADIWTNATPPLPGDLKLIFADFVEVSPTLLGTVQPDVVLSPLLCPAFDCLDLAQRLHKFEYEGRYRVLAPALPNPHVIRSEVKHHCPSLDFNFIFQKEYEADRII
ncbi:MAG: hypothetical protein ACSHXD_03410 [Marinosulfonomonas sp.]